MIHILLKSVFARRTTVVVDGYSKGRCRHDPRQCLRDDARFRFGRERHRIHIALSDNYAMKASNSFSLAMDQNANNLALGEPAALPLSAFRLGLSLPQTGFGGGGNVNQKDHGEEYPELGKFGKALFWLA